MRTRFLRLDDSMQSMVRARALLLAMDSWTILRASSLMGFIGVLPKSTGRRAIGLLRRKWGVDDEMERF